MSSRDCTTSTEVRAAGRSSTAAFTLVEMLLALTLAAIVLAAAAQITVQVARCELVAESLLIDRARVETPFAAIAGDLEAAIGGAKAISIAFDAAHRPELRIVCLAPEAGTSAHVARVPSDVRYRLASDEGGAPQFRLLREQRGFVGHDPPAVTTVACGLVRFDIELWDDGQWLSLTDEIVKKQPEAVAVRIAMRWANDEDEIRRTYVLADGDRGRRRRGR